MASLIRRLILPPIAAASLLVAGAGSALAASPSATVAVFNADGTAAGATVCRFYVEFSTVPGGEEGTWELWDDGANVVDSGSYSVTGSTGDREPDAGTFDVPNGTYTLAWDSEDHIDSSRSEAEIVVSCEAPSQSVAVETEVPSQSVAIETEVPSQSVGAETDVPSQSVAAETEPQHTLPDTTAVDSQGRPDPGAWTGLIAAILGLGAFILVLTPRRGTGRR
jgi:hypothetical protein